MEEKLKSKKLAKYYSVKSRRVIRLDHEQRQLGKERRRQIKNIVRSCCVRRYDVKLSFFLIDE